jgi:DNA-binding response OmpR family regulator
MSKSALVVESENLVRSLVANILHIFQFEVHEANDEESAFELFRRHEHAIAYVYIDYNLRRGSGIRLYQRIRQLDPSVVIVLASGMPDNGMLLVNHDPNGELLLKPFSLESFRNTVIRTSVSEECYAVAL